MAICIPNSYITKKELTIAVKMKLLRDIFLDIMA